MALPVHTLLSAIQCCLEEDTVPTVAAGDASAPAAGTEQPLPPPLPHHVVAALRRDDGADLPSFPVLGYYGEPPPAPRTWTGVPRAPLAAALAEVLATWAAAGAFPLVFAPLSPFAELPVEGGVRTLGVGEATVLRAAAATSATSETAVTAVGVAATAAPTGGSGDCVNGGQPLPRPVGVPDMEALTPTVVTLVRRISQGAYALGGGGGGGRSAHGGTTASGAAAPDNGAAAAARPAFYPFAGDAVATARLLLRSLGAARIARCLGCRTTPTTLVGALPPPAGALIAAAAAPHLPSRRNGAVAPPPPAAAAAYAAAASDTASPRRPRIPASKLTVAGRALMKHLGRRPPGWGACYWGTEAAAAAGGDGAKSAAAATAVARVLTDAVWLNVHALPGGAQGAVVEARVPGGYGARWAWDAGGGGAAAGGFRGFLEPHVLQPRPWEERAAASTAASTAAGAADGGASVGVDDAEEGEGG